MKNNPLFILGALVATTLGANGAMVWTVGMDDNAWPTTGTGGGPNTNFWQEAGTNPLPGNPNSPQGAQLSDDDYYFAGNYSVASLGYPAYSPVGIVAANEGGAERAFAGTDNFLRYHFNLPAGGNALDQYTVTFDALNLHINATTNPDPRYGVEVYFNNVLVGPEVIIRPADLGFDYTTPAFTLSSVGGVEGPGFDNIVELRGINYNGAGGGNWMGVDYVQLDVTPIPEPGSGAMVMLGAIGCTVFLGRRRSRK